MNESSWKSFIAYMLALVFVCVCCIFLISQRAEIAKSGKKISDLHSQAVRLRTQRAYLELEVAERSSHETLLEKMQQMEIKLVSPEDLRETGRRQNR